MRSALIGHRGIPDSYPENSIGGFEAALQSGAAFIETDIQITADHVLVLSHDPTLKKLTGRDIAVTEVIYDDFRRLSAGYPARFGDRFSDYRIPLLEDLTSLVSRWPDVKVFAELKRASIEKHGADAATEILLDSLAPVKSQCIVISFDYPVLEKAGNLGDFPIGWVLPEWSDQNRQLARQLAPEYLFCNRKRLPADINALWSGPWQWVVYTINAPDDIRYYLERGFDLVETNCINQLLTDTK